MEGWNDIINTALLGTEKRPLLPQANPSVAQAGPEALHTGPSASQANPATSQANPAAPLTGPEALRQAMAQIGTQAGLDKEDQFLQIAALTFNVRQSGQKPLHQLTANWAPAVAETKPYCSQQSAQVLKDILEEESQPLLTLWLERCIAAKQIATPELIPILFNRATQHKNIRQAVATTCGRRGEWLSRFNPAWEFSTVTDDEQSWQTGNLDQRKAALKQMRQQDPAKAREWLERSWPQENANTRAELLKQLDGTTQPEDEPFLASALNEKSQKVKDAAISLLQQLPGSRLVSNYAETAAPMIALKKEKALLGLSTKTTMGIQPAPIPEKAAWLSGIDYLSPNKNYKDEEYVLYQLIQYTPPALWEQHLAMAPAGILKMFTGPHEKYASAFAKSIAHFKAADWARAYLAQHEEFNGSLLQLLPLPEREAWVIQNFPKYREPVIQALGGWPAEPTWPAEWSHDLAKAIIAYTAVQPYRWPMSWYQPIIAQIPLSIGPLLKSFSPAEPAHAQLWEKIADRLTALLRLKELTQNAFNE